MTRAVIAKVLRTLALYLGCLLVAACVTDSGSDKPDSVPVVPASAHPATSELTRADREKAIISYRDYLARYPDSPEYDSVTRRLADLLLEEATDLQLAATSTPAASHQLEAQAKQAYAESIDHYEYLLQQDPLGPQSTAVLYQLARAYEESGASQQALTTIDRLLARESATDAQLYSDTCFRQGELLFTQGDYLEAGNSYQLVVDLGASVPAYGQSLYKLGWSLFKQERYSEGLPVLFTFLDRKITPAATYQAQLQGLSPAEREQLADLLRVISRSFAQLGGVNAVDRYFARNGARNYEQQVYLELAQWYIEQDQVSEAADTLQLIAQRKPREARAPRLLARAIELYREAGFQQRKLKVQAQLVRTYGLDSDFWNTHSPADFPLVVQLLQSSLQELASTSHKQALKTGNAEDIVRAEQWYREYLASFGNETAAAEINFQLAELLYATGQYRQALDEYELAAWSRSAHEHAADAALGALHASDKILQDVDAAEQVALRDRATTNTLHFVADFPDHPAAPDLLAQSGTVLLEQQQYERALNASEQALAASTDASPSLIQMAWSLRAQVMFARKDYPEAATAYREALQLAGRDDARRLALQEGLALSVYQRATQALSRGDTRGALVLYQQAAKLAPTASIGSKAVYDAATALLAQESWAEAISWLQQFRRDYPNDPLQQEATRKLAYAYERGGDSSRAAKEYLRIGLDQTQTEALQREALLRAAELFLQTGATAQAITTNERYVEQFPEPAAVAVKVMQQLADLASGNGADHRRQYWLQEIIKLDRTAGNSQTRMPAAEAALELAEEHLAAFRLVQLVNPVQGNLARKIKAMKRALQAFEATTDYGITAVTTAASYHIASMYDELAQALLSSERPPGLTEQELTEYDLLLVQQAAPFEQQAIDIYTTIAQRSDGDQNDPWIAKSAQQLDELKHDR
jgi:tetratricopeptide (TPR) repeat protein